MLQNFTIFNELLSLLKDKKLLINTINAHSFNITKNDQVFKEALLKSDVLIPDGISIVWAMKLLIGKKIKKIAGADLFFFEMKRLQESSGKVFFLGSTKETLKKIRERANIEFPNVNVETYSPPYKLGFSEQENAAIHNAINTFKPDVLFVGMTAPKQEKWSYQNINKLEVGHVCSVGAVFDFYAGTIKRAPQWMINLGIEWSYRLIKEPKRMWRRYLVGNAKFIYYILQEKIQQILLKKS